VRAEREVRRRGSARAAPKGGARACVARRGTSSHSAGAPPSASGDAQATSGQRRIVASHAAGGAPSGSQRARTRSAISARSTAPRGDADGRGRGDTHALAAWSGSDR
jgi:hypothetical protein